VDYITKPFQEEEVIARIESQIRISRLQRELIRKHDELTRTNALLDQQRGELAESNLKLREMDEQKAGFTAMLVHDLKSPLAVVKATFEFLQTTPSVMDALKSESLDSFIESSIYNLDRVLDLVGEVLDVFRSESQELQLLKMQTDLVMVLSRCLEQATVMAGTKKITVEAPDLPDSVMLEVDSGKIERVFSNLLSNAVKFTAKGGTVRLEAAFVTGEGVEAGTRWFRVTVTDTGAGIPPEDLPYIFDPYRQTSATKGRVGVGLGLAIVKRIVAAHGGSVSVRSKVGVGSAFTVELPVG
jgi:two-component system, sensor histidine kinase LadS